VGRDGLHPLLLAHNAISVTFIVWAIYVHILVFFSFCSMRWIVEVVHIRWLLIIQEPTFLTWLDGRVVLRLQIIVMSAEVPDQTRLKP
jgi:hypothetical protein